MTLDKEILTYTQKLPHTFQEEVLNFIQYLLQKAERQEIQEWTSLSLSSAMCGMEDEPDLYNLSDLRINFR